jgi:hypothetical protein
MMPRPFLETFGQLRSGRLMDDCGDALAEIVAAVKATGKPGEMIIKIKVKAPKAGGTAYLMVEDSLSVKTPKLDHGDTVFFHTKDGGLSRQDQTQQELFAPRPVPTGEAATASATRVVDVTTGEIRPLGA